MCIRDRVKAIVVACNTASAFALDAVRDEFDIPIIGVIEPGAKVAAAQTRNKRVGTVSYTHLWLKTFYALLRLFLIEFSIYQYFFT